MPVPVRTIPDDFVQMAKLKTGTEMRKHYKAHSKTVRRWSMEAGVTPLRYPLVSKATPPLPENFLETAKSMTMKEIARHYRASWKTAAAWMLMARLPSITSVRAPAKTYTPPKVLPLWGNHPLPQRDDSAAGSAADFLRRDGWVPVCRQRTIDGVSSRDLWQVGRLRLTTVQMIDKALAKGWEPASA